jgi:hypothetical protein
MGLSKEKIKKWVIDYQHDIVTERYKDVEDGEDLRYFFSRYLYPKFEQRDEYEQRNEFFRKVVNLYQQGRISKVFGTATSLFAPIITMSKKMKELPDYLKIVVELYDLTNELDERLVNELCKIVNSEDELNPENYKIAMKRSSKYEEREKQINYMIKLGEYVRDIVKKGGVLDFLIESCPKVPFFSRSKYVKNINEIITMVQTAYRAFKKTKNKLNYFRDLCLKREYEHLDSLMK